MNSIANNTEYKGMFLFDGTSEIIEIKIIVIENISS